MEKNYWTFGRSEGIMAEYIKTRRFRVGVKVLELGSERVKHLLSPTLHKLIKYPPLFTDTEAPNCSSIYNTSS